MEIDGEKLKFYYRNMLTDVPNTRKLLRKVVALMKTPDDWAVLPRLLEGVCVQAKLRIGDDIKAKLTRNASMAGCVHTILTCAREVQRTNFTLDSYEVVASLLTNIQLEALQADLSEEATKTALQRTERVIEMLEDKKHQRKPTKKVQLEENAVTFPLYKDPVILGARLHMAAARAVKHQGGVDETGKLAKYAKEIAALWPEGKKARELYQLDAFSSNKSQAGGELKHPTSKLITLAPLQNGFALAAQVLKDDEKLAAHMTSIAQALEEENQEAWKEGALRESAQAYGIYKRLLNKEFQ